MDKFHYRIQRAILDHNLQQALDANAERRVKGRVSAFDSLPDWKERRQQAHAVRSDVIECLPEYLDQFIRNAEANGVIVHRAKDANEAVRIILEIVELPTSGVVGHQRAEVRGSRTPKLLAKSKSMVSEEINLNHGLEDAGHRVVETDLGEYIVQLRGEKPAHIITPAVHLRRNDVGSLFHKKLGIPYTEDIPTLTNTARKVLREVFLTADVGLSGVNFGVAETGALCIVTNEGNGRMVTTVPPVHIALMGMERLVRNFDDLALMLSLLPRSATGQKLSVYTQVLHGPLEGQKRHLVLLDNGRSRLRDSSLRESLYCIRCGACLNACPVFREIGGHGYGSVYPGPIGSVNSGALIGPEFAPLAQASSLCGACKDACPVDIDLPKLLTRVRAGETNKLETVHSDRAGQGLSPGLKLGLQLYSRVASSPRLFAFSQKLAELATSILPPMFRIPAYTGWGYSKDFPRFARRPFRDGFKDLIPESPDVGKDALSTVELAMETTTGVVGQNPVERFIAELTTLGGHAVTTRDPSISIAEFLISRGIDRIHLEPGVLDEDVIRRAGITISTEPDPSIRAGVTRALCGLADTGSILVADGAGAPLQASLLPEVHIAVLEKSRILPTLADALPLVRGRRAAVFVTGPSRTADIEMTLTIGVHGPGELHIFLTG